MACTNPQNPDCKNCNKAGLAILPVRYAVVPDNVFTFLPPGLGNKVTDVKLAHHRYALRTLRQGFVYLFYEKNARGIRNTWEMYSVTPNGTVWKQLSLMTMQPKLEEPACSASGHNIPASVITIEKPEKCGKVWIAFSEHSWSPETFKEFASNLKLRDRRMQTIIPSMWVKNKTYRHGLEAAQSNIQTVIEYQDNFNTYQLEPGALPIISQENGEHFPATLKKCSTRYPLHMRKDQSKLVADKMKQIGEHPNGHYPGMVMALWDAVGITHELNGFRNDVAGWIEKYNDERGLQLSAMQGIDAAQKALENNAARSTESASHAGEFAWSKEQSDKRLENARKMYANDPVRLRHEQELCTLWEQDAEQRVPMYIATQRQYYVASNDAQWQSGMQQVNARAAMYTTPNKTTGKSVVDNRNERTKQWEKDAIAKAWPKYENKINRKALETFRGKHDSFLQAADSIIDARTDDLIKWLESKSLISALTEFHETSVEDGLVFEDQIGTALFGINSSVKGRAKIDEWIKELKSTEHNLVWRTIALNQDIAKAELDLALKEADDHKIQQTLAVGLNWTNYTAKSLKAFADTYKKATSVFTANTTASSTAGSKAFGAKINAINTRGTDKFAMAVGDRVFRFFSIDKLADHACEKILQHIFSIRAFVDPSDSIRLIIVQAQNETEARGQLLRRMQSTRAFLGTATTEMSTAQSNNLKAAWTEFKQKNSKAPDIVRDARLALVVMLIEGVNFSKLLADCKMKGDDKSWWLLAASGMSITSALFDVASAPSKALFGAESWSYQRIKLFGGVLSASATAIGAIFDWKDAVKAKEKGQDILKWSYIAKLGFGVTNLAVTAATTFTYSAPMIERLTGRTISGAAVRAVGTRAAAVIGTRILFMSVGGWITVGTISVQVFIWVISDNALQDWCSLNTFGKNHSASDGYKKVDKQFEALKNALIDVGVSG
jgi:hypothetical protein